VQAKRVCVVPRLSGTGMGGPSSFYQKLKCGLETRGISVALGFGDEPYDAVLVINGTRNLARLWRWKRRGIRIVQRLGAINQLHHLLPVGVRRYVLMAIRNFIMSFIRSFFADHVVYQSCFVRDSWDREFGTSKVASSVIHNGVDLTEFSPQGPRYQSQADVCIISVEGRHGNDPFDIPIHLAQYLEEQGLEVELLMFGRVWDDTPSRLACYPFVNFMGTVPNPDLPYFYRGATFYISTDIISAGCPNGVVEALACGTPVLGYKAGVLPELLDESAGRCVEPQGDLWAGEPPGNPEGMVSAALELARRRDHFDRGARSLAEERYGLGRMVSAYAKVLLE
jgi:glycosyltransferase involved in cell wall biosynthesis